VLETQGATDPQSLEKVQRVDQEVLSIEVKHVSCTNQVAWLHVPTAGNGFGTAVAHHANCTLPDEAVMPEPGASGDCAGDPEVCFIERWRVKEYFQNLLWMKNGNWGNHDGITPVVYQLWKGKFVGMFRKPASRMLSAWQHFANNDDPMVFADQAAGGMTKMLAGQENGFDCLMKALNRCKIKQTPKLDLALDRLRHGFKFVGLSEEFDLSICLLHAMFGGRCFAAEFVNTRPGSYSTELRERNPFVKFYDPDDEAIYKEASQIFWSRVKEYKVTARSCKQYLCPNAGLRWPDDPT